MKKGLIITILVLFVIGGTALAIALTRPKKSNTSNTASTSINVNQPSSQSSNGSSANSAATITYNGSDFSPATVTVKSGSTITIKNTSSEPLQFDSDPHPTHTDDPELNLGLVQAGSSQTLTVTQIGSHGYHNHLNSTQRGTIIVN